MIQVNAQGSGAQKEDPCSQPPSQEQVQACNEVLKAGMALYLCMVLKSKMADYNTAAVLYTKSRCSKA
jgi:hypothetical protein